MPGPRPQLTNAARAIVEKENKRNSKSPKKASPAKRASPVKRTSPVKRESPEKVKVEVLDENPNSRSSSPSRSPSPSPVRKAKKTKAKKVAAKKVTAKKTAKKTTAKRNSSPKRKPSPRFDGFPGGAKLARIVNTLYKKVTEANAIFNDAEDIEPNLVPILRRGEEPEIVDFDFGTLDVSDLGVQMKKYKTIKNLVESEDYKFVSKKGYPRPTGRTKLRMLFPKTRQSKGKIVTDDVLPVLAKDKKSFDVFFKLVDYAIKLHDSGLEFDRNKKIDKDKYEMLIEISRSENRYQDIM